MIVQSQFKPAWWLPGPHSQTLWPNRLRPRPRVHLIRERIELADGDFIDLEWTARHDGPIVLVLHGLEGHTRSGYAAGILRQIHLRGWRGAFVYQRSCSGTPNRLHRRYHAGETSDLQTLFELLTQREPHTPIAVVGYSLGGNILLKWLGELEHTPPALAAAVAVSVPFDLHIVTERLNQGFSRIYQYAMLSRMQRSVKSKPCYHHSLDNLGEILCLKTLREFDDAFTAPVHGFRDVHHFYHTSSCRKFLKHIHFPTLILHSQDDPFMTPEAIPTAPELSAQVTLELAAHGGHVGFVYGSLGRPRYYLEERIPDYLADSLRKL